MKDLKKQFGEWAIVTGASSGIGAEFAKQLASLGFNLIILARREALLNELKENLELNYSIMVKTLKVDLTQDGYIDAISKEIEGLDARLLVSNAGAAHMGAFHKIPLENLKSMAKLNVYAQLELSHWFSSRLIDQSKIGGLILLSSGIAYQGTPYAANYSASKAYILNLGEALHLELKNYGIHVSVLVPGPTDAPGLTDRTDANMVDGLPMKPQPVEALVHEGIDAIIANKPYHIGGTMNRFMTNLMGLVMSRKKASSFWGSMMKKMVVLK